jgi:FlaA1/EpsC-like NDP-sugar epimerase
MGLAYGFRGQWGGLKPFREYIWIVFFAFFIWYFLLSRYGLYASIRQRGLFDIATSLANVHLWGGAFLAALIYLIEPRDFSRGLFLSFLTFSFLLLSTERLALRLGLGYFRKLGFNFRNILIVGTQEKARKFSELVADHADWGIKLLGFVQVDPDARHEEILGQQVLGQVENLIEICKTHSVDEVVFCPPKHFVLDAEAYLRDLEELGITTRMVLNFYEVSHARTELPPPTRVHPSYIERPASILLQLAPGYRTVTSSRS